MGIKHLDKARINKNDEYYTLYSDIEDELKHYDKEQFYNKIVLCPCDDYRYSNFVKYFKDNFEQFKLKKLIARSISGFEYTFDGDKECINEIENGDFHTVDFNFDIIVTNPPFSLFRDFFKFCLNKKFIIIGNLNALAYVDVFPRIKDKSVWLGARKLNKTQYFEVPEWLQEYLINESKNDSGYKIIDSKIYGRLSNCCWLTNMNHDVIRYFDGDKLYNPEKYSKYDNIDAIEINKVKDIPIDYTGVMGVPITFLDKWDSGQYELIRIEKNAKINGKRKYNRILIQKI